MEMEDLKQLKKTVPLYLKKEKEHSEWLDRIEEERFQQTAALRQQRGRVTLEHISAHQNFHDNHKQKKLLKLEQDRIDFAE